MYCVYIMYCLKIQIVILATSTWGAFEFQTKKRDEGLLVKKHGRRRFTQVIGEREREKERKRARAKEGEGGREREIEIEREKRK